MPYQTYIKDNSTDPFFKSVNYGFFFKSKMMSGMIMALGFLVLGTQVVLPLVFFKTQNEVAKPIRSSVLGVATGFSDFEFNELQENVETAPQSQDIPDFFYLSIPKLKIEEAVVETNSTNLSPETSLGHYKGSALPGNTGNAFIYGHSVLPWFFNPSNYRTIFSTLGDLNKGDEIQISYNNKILTYRVESKEILSPELVKPLENWKPDFLNDSTITLMTCWPAGTRTNRLIVKALLTD